MRLVIFYRYAKKRFGTAALTPLSRRTLSRLHIQQFLNFFRSTLSDKAVRLEVFEEGRIALPDKLTYFRVEPALTRQGWRTTLASPSRALTCWRQVSGGPWTAIRLRSPGSWETSGWANFRSFFSVFFSG